MGRLTPLVLKNSVADDTLHHLIKSMKQGSNVDGKNSKNSSHYRVRLMRAIRVNDQATLFVNVFFSIRLFVLFAHQHFVLSLFFQFVIFMSRFNSSTFFFSFLDLYNQLLLSLDIGTAKSKLVFLILSIIVLVLVVTLIVLICLWPSIPSYFYQPECISKSCLEASLDIISWSSQNRSECAATHEWACGGFVTQYANQELYQNFPGEWSADNYYKFEGGYMMQCSFYSSSVLYFVVLSHFLCIYL